MAIVNNKSSVMSARAPRKSSILCQMHIDDLLRGEMRRIEIRTIDTLRKKEPFPAVFILALIDTGILMWTGSMCKRTLG